MVSRVLRYVGLLGCSGLVFGACGDDSSSGGGSGGSKSGNGGSSNGGSAGASSGTGGTAGDGGSDDAGTGGTSSGAGGKAGEGGTGGSAGTSAGAGGDAGGGGSDDGGAGGSSSVDWIRQFGLDEDDVAYAVAADGASVLVAGQVSGALPMQNGAGGYDAFVRKYDSDGGVVWTRQFGLGASDSAYSMIVDANSNVIAVGQVYGALPNQNNLGSFDAYVRMYDSDGGELWTSQFGTSTDDLAYAVAVDGDRNVLVAGDTFGLLPGQTSSGTGGYDAFVSKYGPDGTPLWTRQFGSSGTDSDEHAWAVAADSAGNVLVAGDAEGTFPGQGSSGRPSAFVRKYDPDGMPLWTRQFNLSSAGTIVMTHDSAQGVAVNAADDVFVAGYLVDEINQAGVGDGFVIKYDRDGTEQWTRRFGSSLSSSDDQAFSVAVDGNGNVLVVGDTVGAFPEQMNEGFGDVFVRKYNPSGTELWTRQFGTDGDDSAVSVAADSTGRVLVSGFVTGELPGQTAAGMSDAFVLRMSP